ncbi:MAG: class I SAM-dependent methyltransferase [Planctomycetes bacterium]|nr:class I SAM-dependent methyltransferase [Planctomycetota bacterium]
MVPTPEQAAAGQAVYTPRMLRLYDILVLGLSNRLIWKCPTAKLLQLYNDSVSDNHLDVGVGTGYYLDRCRFPTDQPQIALLDMNPNCLYATANRISRYEPTCHEANIFEPLTFEEARFKSIALNYVLHCLPGAMQHKLVAVRHLAELLTPGGLLFGSTLLSGGVQRGWPARCLMSFYNRKQIFSNTEDDLATLERGLAESFDTYDVEVVGCAALFRGHRAS